MKEKNSKKTKKMIVSALAISAMLTGSAFAAESTDSGKAVVGSMMNHMRGSFASHAAPTAFGKITAISGTTLTLTGKSNTSYTIDASNAKIYKGKDTVIAVGNLAVNDMVVVEGTLSGTTVTATSVRVGGPRGVEGGKPSMMAPRGVMGTVSTVSGSNFTVATPAFMPRMHGATTTGTSVVATTPTLVNVVTGSNTVFMKDGATSTIAAVTSGVRVLVEGAKDTAGTTVTATKVLVITKVPTGMMEGEGRGHMMRRSDNTSSQ